MQSNIKTWLIGIFGLIIGAAAMFAFIRSTDPHAGHDHSDHQTKEQTGGSDSEDVWTCSMHPNIRQGEPGDCPICGMDLTLATDNESNDPLVLQMTEAAVQLANIQTTIVYREAGTELINELRLSGKIQADERLASSQVAQVSGRIEQLYVSFTGEQVQAGQKLADIYAPEFIAAQRELLEAKKLSSTNPALLEAARTKLRYWKISPEKITSIEENGEIQEVVGVYANKSGVVTNRRIAVGDFVRQGEPLFDLMGLQRVWVLFDAYEEDLPKLRMGSQISFQTPALPGQTFTAPITFVDPVINPQTRVASLRAELNNAGKKLKPEMLVSGTVALAQVGGGNILAPKSAVMWTGPRSVVYVKVPDASVPSFQFREVNLGDAVGSHYQILSGLEEGEEVVTNGSFVIDAAAQLNNQASMTNQDVALKPASGDVGIPDFTASVDPTFRQQLERVVNAYLDLKDVLIDTDADAAAEKAKALYNELLKVDGQVLSGKANSYWKEKRQALEGHSKKLGELTDVEEQRVQFDFLSQALIETLKAFGGGDQTYYVQYCPMAFRDQGAAWLSAEDKVLNPYFGDLMLRCGVVQETITTPQ
ncbi:MAG: efflux RND transporter periplasmic adaptor subunit [Bacteroidota bacterium]